MDPSIMKLLEEDEDESMHSGADVEALSAALNRDIGGDPAALARPPESDTGVSMLGSSSASKQVLGQWQTSSEVENEQQIQQKEQKRHLQSSEQHSSGGELIQAGSVSQPQDEQINNQPQHDCPTIQQEASHSDDLQRQPEANLLEKEQHSENQQQHIVQQSNSQQIPTSNQANMAMRRTKAASSIPFHLLIPILRPHLDKDRSMQLQAIFAKLRNNEVSKEDFLRVIRNIVGDQMLRQAAQKVQVQMDGNTGVDAEKDKEDGRPKALKANKEEDDKMRATAANVAARAAVGGDDMLSKWQLMAEQARQKREGLDGAPGKTASSKPLLSLGRSSREKQESEKKGSSAVSASGGTRRFGRKNALESHPKVARNVSLKDVIAALEREPQMSKSALIYRLYERLSSNSSAT